MPDEEKMQKLLTNANQAITDLQQTINNYKKSPKDRLTEAYITSYKAKLDTLWLNFQSVDRKLRDVLPESHSYFNEDTYGILGRKHNEILEQIDLELSKLKELKGASTSITINNPSPSLHKNESVTSLQKLQTIIKTVRTMISQVLAESEQPSAFYERKLKCIEQHWTHANSIHEKLWASLENYDYEAYVSEEEAVNNGMIDIQLKATHSTTDPIPTPRLYNNQINNDNQLRLPKIELPIFNGEYLKWRNFHDLFSELVDKKPIPHCQKLLYLKSSLSGEAEGLVQNYATTSDNYTIVWQTLKDRYDNKRILVNAILQKLLTQTTMHHESVVSLKLLHDTTHECLQSLNNLGIATESWDPMVLHILVQHLSKPTHALWEQSLSKPQELPSLSDFLNFIKLRFQSLEALGAKVNNQSSSNRIQAHVSGAPTQLYTKCFVCQGTHKIYACPSFLQRSPKERLQLIQKSRRCVNCLRIGHSAKECNSSSCSQCKKRHNSLLHLETPNSQSKQSVSNNTQASLVKTQSPQHIAATAFKSDTSNFHSVLLSTVIVNVTDNDGEQHPCRALLDSGSQANFISAYFAKKLGLPISPRELGIEGIGQTQSHSTGRINIEFSSTRGGYKKRIEVLILPRVISSQPMQPINTSGWKIPKNISLADPAYAKPGRIDLLIGAGLFYSLLSVGQISLGSGLPTIQKTLLGWIISGEYPHTQDSTLHCGIGITNAMEDSLEKFWKLEEFEPGTKNFTESEMRCEKHFLQNVRKHDDGRFIVKLPFELNPQHLGSSKDIALQRFYSLERKLERHPQLRSEYIKFMKEYETLNHMSEIPIDQIESNHYFLPHHAVFKLDSTTTKVRVVFDASAKTSSNYSLNDLLSTGPTIQSDVFTTILRFRFPRYAFTADIEKMYRQIWVSKEDQKYQLIWWRENPTEPLRCLKLATVTYGTSCAPFLATRVLQHIADTHKDNFPMASRALKNNFYVDDALAGADKITEALELQKQLIDCLRSSGLNLRKWCANDTRLLEKISYKDKEVSLDMSDSISENIKTMGMTWYPKKDVFTIKIHQDNSTKITKRTALAEIAKLFDPLGLVAPVVVTAKIFLQQLWKLKLDWDSALPQEMHSKWLTFRNELIELQKIDTPRHIYNHTTPKSMQLHVFSDASESAYGAVAYVRSVDAHNVVIVRLLLSKSRVAPVKQLSIPRLELCAAKLATDLVARLHADKILETCDTFYWTDSTAVLGWINATSSNYHTFVANRISGIHQISKPQQWHHVRSEQNPADLISRGIMPSQLVNNTLWFFGPFFLHGAITGWPLQPPKANCTLEMREKKLLSGIAAVSSESIFTIIQHRNSLPRLQRIIAYMMKFKTIKQPQDSKTSQMQPTAKEMDNAIKILVKISQQEYFADELRSLNKHQSVHNNSVISTLSPFIDDEGIIRVGGRLKASGLQFDAKHQMLLPYSSPLTKMIFMALHKENKHVGAQTLLCIVRQRFWPIKGKNIARSVVQGCILCTKARPKLYQQLMGNLPKDRVQPARPFVNTGVDFFGPIWVHMKIRGKRPLKAYVAVFCCFAVKAVHLELVSDLSTEAFLGALRRFMARRGHCNKIYCDNATNFVGASNQLSEFRNILHTDKAKEKILHECGTKNIAFEFIPPRAPHFGGLWEAAVKSAKHLLQSSLSATNLTGEEIQTLLAEAEAIMNSRPLTPLSADPNDLTALTPGHFLIGEPLTATADPYDQQNQLKPLTRWKLVTQLKREFWTRWTNEYLHSLQHRYKWKKEVQNIHPGTMVLIKDDNLPSMKWSLGRIKNVIRGEDGLVRVADVQTSKQIIRRPITKLAPLPTEQETEPVDDNNHHETETTLHDTSSPKRPRLTSLASTLFLVLLLLPICVAEKMEVVPFQRNPGIYFENIGSANIISSEWTVISYVNITNYWKWTDRVKHYPDTLREFCEITKRRSCSSIVSLLEHSTSELELNNELLRHNPVKRKKRGAVNIIGNIAHSLFGVLDENYAADTAVTINQLVQNEKRIVNEVQQQKTFLDNTINIMKKGQQEIEQEFKKIELSLDKFKTFIQQKQGENEFMELALQTTLAASYLQRIQESLLDVLTDSHHGRINPELISPVQLETEIHRIKAELPSSLKIPDTSDFLKLLSLTHIESRIIGDLAIFVIKIPLVTPEEYEILHLVPIPFIRDNTFNKVKTEYTFIIINLHRDQYYLLKETSLTSCVHLEDQRFLCHENHPLHLQGSRAGLCEINLLNQVNNTLSCSTEVTEPGPHWFQLHNQNWWLFALRDELVLNVVCNNKLTKITLKRNGLLKLMENCVVKQPHISIKAYKRYRTSELKGYIPDIDATLIIPTHNHQYIKMEPLKSLNLSASISALEKIQNTRLNLELDTPDEFRSHDIHHYLLGYTCLSGILILCGYLIKRWYSKRKAPGPAPVPVPIAIKPTISNDRQMDDHESAIITISQG